MKTHPGPDGESVRISGLVVVGQLGRGSRSTLHLARHRQEGEARQVVLKVLRRDAAEDLQDDLLRFRREAARLACLAHPAFPEVYEVGCADGRPYLVRALHQGRTLEERLSPGPMPADAVVRLGRRLAVALRTAHRHGHVHAALCPRNVLLDDAGIPGLLDLSFAARGPHSDLPPDLAYAAPEQTGLLHRPCDARTDLYALGALLFACAAGRPPFVESDAELVRMHVASPPPDLAELVPGLPTAFAALVARLLAKDPDDRPSTAEEVIAALHHLERPDQPATASVRWTPPLVERTGALSRLTAAWNEVVRGRGGVALVEGDAGAGKTRLAEALADWVRQTGGVVLWSACARQSPGPFAPLRQLIDALAEHVRALSGPEREAAKAAIRTAAGESTETLLALSPALAAALGEPPSDATAPTAAEPLYGALSDFLHELSTAHLGVLVVVDDVQWLDGASRQVLWRLARHLEGAPLMVLFTAGTEREESSAVARVIDGLTGGVPLRITVEALSQEGTARLVSAWLGGRAPDADLAKLVHARSTGSPFAVEQYVDAMLESGLLRPHWGRWVVAEDAYDAIGLPGNVLELLVRRVERLHASTRSVLRTAAVLGLRFSAKQLAAALGGGAPERIRAALADGATAGVLERRTQEGGRNYRFVHAQVRDVLLRELDLPARREAHQAIACAMEAEGDADVFALARHYALGNSTETPERARAANLAAGAAAFRRFADEDAYQYFETAARLSELAGLPPDPALDDHRGQVCTRLGRLGEAVTAFERALEASESPLDRARIRTRLAWLHGACCRGEPALVELGRAFAELDRPVPRGGPVRTLFALGRATLARGVARLGMRIPPGQEARAAAYAELLEAAAHIGYIALEPRLTVRAILDGAWIAERLGRPRQRAMARVLHAILRAGTGRSVAARRLAADAIADAEHTEDPQLMARVLARRAWALHLAGHPRDAELLSRRCVETYGRWLDPVDYASACHDLAWNAHLRGYSAAAVAWVERAHERLGAGAEGGSIQGHPYANPAGPALAAIDRAEEGARVLRAYRAVAETTPAERLRWADLLAHETGFRLEVGDLDSDFEDGVLEFEGYALPPETVNLHLRHFYVFHAYARARLGRIGPLRDAIDVLRQAAVTPVLSGHLRVCEATAARLDGDLPGALEALREAEATAEAQDAPWVLFEALRERAHVRLARDDRPAATRAARLALSLAGERGWTLRARRLREDLPHLGLAVRAGVGRSAPADPFALRARRHLEALLNVSLALTGTLDPRGQISQTLDQLVQLLGAERAFLFLVEPDGIGMRLGGGRDATGDDLGVADLEDLAIVERVRAQHRPVVSGSHEIASPGPRSVIAAPLNVADRLAGVVYLDSEAAVGIFGAEDVDILVAVASHIPAALETARAAQLDIYGRIASNVPGMVFQMLRGPAGELSFPFASEGVRDLLGVSALEVERDAQLLTDALHPADRGAFAASVARAVEGAGSWRWTGRSADRGDARKWLEGAARVERRADGTALLDGIILDVTDRMAAEHALRRLNEDLERRVGERTKDLAAANRELEAFTYSASHDLQGSLRTVIAFSDAVQCDYGELLDDEGRHLLSRIQAAGQRISEMLDSMLALSRVGRVALERVNLNLGKLAESVVEDLRRDAPGRDVELVVGGELGVHADAHLMHTVVQNLVGNAWKFTGKTEGARIEVGCDPDERGERVFYVRDNGAGFDMEYAERLWQVFQRLHDARDFEGTGVGLASVKRVLDRHGGRIWAEGTEGEGATFYFTLPSEGGRVAPGSLPPPPKT